MYFIIHKLLFFILWFPFVPILNVSLVLTITNSFLVPPSLFVCGYCLELVEMKTKASQQKSYSINFDIKNLKTIRKSKPSPLGRSFLIFILRDEQTLPALYFHKGGTKAVISELHKHLIVQWSVSRPPPYPHPPPSPPSHMLYHTSCSVDL